MARSSDTDQASTTQQPKKKICCACPETKGKRDECVIVHGPEAEQCQKLIEAHKICLRAEGFKV